MAYSFAPLTPPQIEERRKQLDFAGFYAWLTPIILLVGIYLYRQLTGLLNARATSNRKANQVPSQLQIISRRIAWTLDTTYIPEFGPLKVQLTGVVYALWLLYLVFRNTGEDYMHLTKAFGHVAISQLPLQYLLSFKPSYSLITLATGLTHEKLNAYHRLLGRIIHGLLAAHAIMYMRFFIILDLLSKRIQHRDVRLGLAAFWTFNILGLLAVPPIRKRMYHKLFYRSHVLLSAVAVPLLFFHVSYTRKYVLQAGFFWIVCGLVRVCATVKARVTCRQIQGTDLIEVRLAVDTPSDLIRATPGQHVYIQHQALGPKNPFTVVRAHHQPTSHEKTGRFNITLVVRNLGGPQTALLAELAADKRSEEHDFFVEGPYGESSQYLPRLLASASPSSRAVSTYSSSGEAESPKPGPSQILLVAGGVGATYALPIYVALLDARGGTSDIKFLWLVRTLDDARWGIALLESLGSAAVDVDIYVTRQVQAPAPAQPSSAQTGLKIHTTTTTRTRPLLSSILNDTTALFTPSSPSASTSTKHPDHHHPNVILPYDKLTVLTCGPPALTRDLRKEVGRHVLLHGREVEWFEEQFGLGGS